jgi:hypothetical protein
MELNDFRSWPIVGAKSPQEDAAEPVEYAEASTGSLVSRAVATIQDWGEAPAEDKTAAGKASLWKNTDAHPVALMLTLLDRYGQDCVTWEPEVLKVTLLRDGIQVSNTVWTKILAVRVVMNSPSPWRQWEAFHWVCRGLAGQPPNFTYLEQPEIGHLMLGIDVCKIIDPKRPFDLEVEKFIVATLMHDGHVFAPAPLDFVTRELENPRIECKKCGAIHRDDNDVKCITCGSTQLVKLPYEHAKLRDACAAQWKARSGKEIAEAVDGLPEDAAGNLVYNLLLQWDYARHCRRQLLHQLRDIARP